MSSIKSCPGLVECCHSLSHQSINEHREKYSNDDDLMEMYLQSQIEIVTQERLLDDYNKAELQSIIPLDLNNNGIIMSPSFSFNHRRCSFDDYTRDKSALIMKGLGLQGKLIPFVFNHHDPNSKKKKGQRKRHSIRSIFQQQQQQQQEGFVAFRYPKTVDVHTLRSITIRLLIGLSPPYLSQKHVF
ncbi:hypothetical protein K501DRAFT_277617 [Backusella circina FSU 941]|nr:hypothetical protein K501DRAFT_277617 [Backusella circina FSU 941]